MAAELKIVEEASRPLSMQPKKFALWIFMATVMMLFGAWTSAYIVKRGDVGWNEVVLPWHFWLNTGVIMLSSFTMILSSRAARKDNLEQLRLLLGVTTLFGIAFLIGQYFSFSELIFLKQYFTGGSASHSFIYVLTGAHGAHVIGGVIYLLIVLVMAWKNQLHSKNMTALEMCSTYWHFLGILWLYLFVFLLLNP
ncbi:MAG TPA: cytochrome c oxidase subunit 3 [Ohtaekwangia sp.]|nr:cytochrome c oxidase subunit 3 [Ohtaekwangia sp.]